MSKETDGIVKASKPRKRLRKAKKETTKDKPKTKTKKPTKSKFCGYLSSGSTMVNLACTDDYRGAFPKGKYTFFVGDSTSGKTFLSMSCFAEANSSPEFKDYELIYDNVEDGCDMDLEGLFGKGVADRIQAPAKDGSMSFTIEEFYYNLDDCIKHAKKNKTSFIYILDSMDGLSSESEGDKFEDQKKAHEKGNVTAGSYGDGKAKKNAAGIRRAMKGLRDTDSILIIVSQTRDNIGFGFEKKTRSGGHALKFYAHHEIWTSLGGRISKTVKGKKRNIGIKAIIKIKKNRSTGGLHEVRAEIYPSYGIDDIGSCIDYLVEEGWWSKVGKSNIATGDEIDFEGSREKLIQHIEDNDLVQALRETTGACWLHIKEASSLKRKKRYE